MTVQTVDAPHESAPLVRVRGLGIEIDDPRVAKGEGTQLVRDVSFDLHRGQALGVAGESGSGKSLTATAVANLRQRGVRRSHGRIEIAGQQVDPASPGTGQRVAMIFQNPMTSLNPSMRIGQQIAEAVRMKEPGISRRDAARRAVEVLDQVEIDRAADRARQYPFEFSGGMRQRAMIGIAVACQPEVLVADEPTTALDVTVQHSVMNLLDRLRVEMGLAILLISHDLSVLSERCENLLIMYAGQVVEAGPAQTVLAQPVHPYTEGLLRCIPEYALATGELKPIPGRVPPPSFRIPGCRFADRCDWAIGACHAEPVQLSMVSPDREIRCIRWRDRLPESARSEYSSWRKRAAVPERERGDWVSPDRED